MADAAHLSADIIGFGFSIVALKLSQRSSSDTYSYGWHRAEIVGTLASIMTIWILNIWLVYEATLRFFKPPEVSGWIMLIVACLALVVNLIQIGILHTGDGHYHLGGESHDCDHGHDHGGHGHDHGHDHKHDHGHDHKHDHGHDHKHEHNNKDDH